VRERQKLRTLGELLAITILWMGILLVVVMGTVFGDCFEPGCGDEKDRNARIAIALVGIGFIAHVVGHFWLKARRARRD
jgi:hypothetical protein